jgi:hypothetical protein
LIQTSTLVDCSNQSANLKPSVLQHWGAAEGPGVP